MTNLIEPNSEKISRFILQYSCLLKSTFCECKWFESDFLNSKTLQWGISTKMNSPKIISYEYFISENIIQSSSIQMN